MERNIIVVDGVKRELVRVVVKPTPGNPEGRPRLDYRDHMAPGEQTVEEAAAGIKAEVGTRPDDADPGIQVGTGSPPAEPIKRQPGRPRKT